LPCWLAIGFSQFIQKIIEVRIILGRTFLDIVDVFVRGAVLAKTLDDVRNPWGARLDRSRGGLYDVCYGSTRLMGRSGVNYANLGTSVIAVLAFDLVEGPRTIPAGSKQTVLGNLVENTVDLTGAVGDEVGGAAFVGSTVMSKSEVEPILGED